MTNRRIKELMRDIDPRFQQKADARAAAVVHTPHRSIIPSLLVCGATACCAAFAAAIILPQMKSEQIDIAASEEQCEISVDSESEYTENVTDYDVDCFLGGVADSDIRLMSPAYAPYVLDISEEQQKSLASELAAAALAAKINAEEAGTVWEPCDPDMPYPDGDVYSIFVFNFGIPYRLNVYSDNTVVKEVYGDKQRRQFADGIYDKVAEFANPAQTDGHLTWCDEDTLNSAYIWENTNVAAKKCDMMTKDGVFYKMSNTMDYYNRVSCVTVSGTRPEGSMFNTDRSTLRADLNAGKASEYLEYFYSDDADALMNGCEGCTKDDNGAFITAKDGEKFYRATEYNHECYEEFGIRHRIDCPPVENDQRKPDEMEFDDYDFYNSRQQILEGMGLNSFEWGKLVLGYLYEFDTWDIVGTETVNGRNCVHIKGKANDKFIFADFVSDFDMYTDIETGVLVKLLGYNTNGELSHFVNTLNLKFEDDAEPFEMPDLSDYHIYEASEPVYAYLPGEGESEPTEPVTDTDS